MKYRHIGKSLHVAKLYNYIFIVPKLQVAVHLHVHVGTVPC